MWSTSVVLPRRSTDSCFVVPCFSRFQTELNYDFLEIHDGPNLLSPLIASLNGTQVPHFLFSSGNFLYLLFTTDSSRSNSGFKLFYERESSGRAPDVETLMSRTFIYAFDSLILRQPS